MANPFRRNSDSDSPSAQPYSAPRAITAAAKAIKVGDPGEAEAFRKRRASSSSFWQAEAWEYYDAIHSVKYAYNLAAQIVSRIRIFAAVVEDPSEAPAPIRTSSTVDQKLAAMAERALQRLDSAYGGQAGLLRDAALNLNVAGECYLVQIPARPGSNIPESWDIRSVDELQVDRNGDYVIVPRRDLVGAATQGGSAAAKSNIIKLPKGTFVGRMWRAHPRFSEEPDAALRGLLDLCNELLLLNRTFRATHRSRLNAGALYIPDGLSYASTVDSDVPFEEQEDGYLPEESEDDFEEQLMDAMTTPIKEEDSASAVVPLIIRGPAELADKVKLIQFERSFDDAMIAREKEVRDQILEGLDVPKDLITGMANVKYSNAQQIDDALYKSHIEPMIILIADAITQTYLKPYLIAQGYPQSEVDRIVVWYDPSSISTRTDRAGDADSGFEKNAISAETWRRAHGFSEADAPTSNEYAIKLLTQHGSLSPELTEALLAAVAPGVINATRQASQEANPAPIPTDVANVLDGGQPDPAAASTDADAAAPADGSAAVQPPASADPVDAGEDAPAFNG